jgi:hypothetical protein
MAGQEIRMHASSVSSVREAAAYAAESLPPGEPQKHAEAIMAAWQAKIKEQTDKFVKEATRIARKPGEIVESLAGPITTTTPLYPWWNILIAGPFQPAPAPGGPYLPNKIFRPGESAFCIGAVWLNPAPINWAPPGVSAALMMSALNLTIRFNAINLNTATPGPALPAVVMAPLGAAGPLPWLKFFTAILGPGVFPVPPEGSPVLYELNVTADATGPGSTPFAGYCTWVFDPDIEPPIFPPFLLPGVPPTWQYDIPMRFMTYT